MAIASQVNWPCFNAFRLAMGASTCAAKALRGKKNNRGELGAPIDVEFKDGLFRPVHGPLGLDKLAAEKKADDVFLNLVARFQRENRNASPNPGPTFRASSFQQA
jgi:hypothetical protein